MAKCNQLTSLTFKGLTMLSSEHPQLGEIHQIYIKTNASIIDGQHRKINNFYSTAARHSVQMYITAM